MLAIVAWSLSVVDVAIVLGPGNPPTLAVLSWQWLSQGDAEQQAKGALASLLLVLLLLIIALAGYLLWRAWQRTIPAVNGERLRFHPVQSDVRWYNFCPLAVWCARWFWR